MSGGWDSRAEEEDYIADVLHGTEQDIKGEVDQGRAPEAARQRADKISENAETHRDEAAKLRQRADSEAP